MGLDMYLLARKDENDQCTRIHYWRKHHSLHNLMESIWINKGKPLPEGAALLDGHTIDEVEFNCLPLELTDDDLQDIVKKLKSKSVSKELSFFSEDYVRIINKARTMIKDGYHVYYDSWW